MMSLWDALRMNMMISYQELVRTFPKGILPLAVLAAVFPQAALATTTGTDLMKTGDGTVKATFGSGSSVVKWVILAEVIVGGIMYMMTKNVKFLAGFAILSVFVTVGMSVAGY